MDRAWLRVESHLGQLTRLPWSIRSYSIVVTANQDRVNRLTMRIIRTRDELMAVREAMLGQVGLVPTMGALHDGHLALVEVAQRECAGVLASIFVNPTQFNNAEIAASYPRDEENDLRKLEDAGCDAVWLPSVGTIYPPGDATTINPTGPALHWEGTHRPGHFQGMATVVAKLFGLARPDAAFFGEKDWQQLQVVRRMVADLALPVRVVGVETVREADGLAMSSRNRFLDAQQRAAAPLLFACLQRVAGDLRSGMPTDAALAAGRTRLEQGGLGVDYLALVDAATLRPVSELAASRLIAAVRLGPVRLLDNIAA